MSETAPESTPGGGGKFGLFTEKIGPLPMWAWVAIIAAALIGWRLYSAKKNAASTAGAGTAADGTSANDVPQFVNQTYVTTTPPVQGPPPVQSGPIESFGPVPPKQPGPQQLTRTWTAPVGSVSDLAQIAQRLTGTTDPGLLHPVNKTAQNFIAGPYKKNRNAKVPKGAQFSYSEGTVTPKGGAVPTVK